MNDWRFQSKIVLKILNTKTINTLKWKGSSSDRKAYQWQYLLLNLIYNDKKKTTFVIQACKLFLSLVKSFECPK